jgi:hypothetical protein
MQLPASINGASKAASSRTRVAIGAAQAARHAAPAPRARKPLAVVSAAGQDAAQSSDPPARQAIAGVVRGIYKLAASFQAVDSTLPPLWQAVQKLDASGVAAAIRAGGDVNARNAAGDTPLLYIAREVGGAHWGGAHALGLS